MSDRTPVPVDEIEPEELAALLDDENVLLILDWADFDPSDDL